MLNFHKCSKIPNVGGTQKQRKFLIFKGFLVGKFSVERLVFSHCELEDRDLETVKAWLNLCRSSKALEV